MVLDNLVQGNAKSLCRDKAKGFWREGFTQLSVDGESPTEAQQMQDANYKEETQNKHLFQTSSYQGLGEEEPVLGKFRASPSPVRNNKQSKQSSSSLSGDAASAAGPSCRSASDPPTRLM